MAKNVNTQVSFESEVYLVANRITTIIEKYTDQIELLDVIDIVDNLRVLIEIAESTKPAGKAANVA